MKHNYKAFTLLALTGLLSGCSLSNISSISFSTAQKLANAIVEKQNSIDGIGASQYNASYSMTQYQLIGENENAHEMGVTVNIDLDKGFFHYTSENTMIEGTAYESTTTVVSEEIYAYYLDEYGFVVSLGGVDVDKVSIIAYTKQDIQDMVDSKEFSSFKDAIAKITLDFERDTCGLFDSGMPLCQNLLTDLIEMENEEEFIDEYMPEGLVDPKITCEFGKTKKGDLLYKIEYEKNEYTMSRRNFDMYYYGEYLEYKGALVKQYAMVETGNGTLVEGGDNFEIGFALNFAASPECEVNYPSFEEFPLYID